MPPVIPAQGQDAGSSSPTKEAYREFLKTDTWQKLRKRRLMIDAYRCQECGIRGSGAVLDVHHLNYDRPWGQETMADLVTLCRQHHYTKHKGHEEARMAGDLATLSEANPFAHLMHTDERGEYWMGRETIETAGYASWRNYEPVILKALETLIVLVGEIAAQDHIAEERKMVPLGSGSHREINDYRMTRYGMYMAMSFSAKPDLKQWFVVMARAGELAMTSSPVEVTTKPPVLALPDAVLMAAMNSDVTSITPMKNGGIRFNRRRVKVSPPIVERPKLFRPAIFAVEKLGFQDTTALYTSLRKLEILSWYNGNSRDGNILSREFVTNGWGKDTVQPCGPGKRDFYVPEFTDEGIEVIRERVSM